MPDVNSLPSSPGSTPSQPTDPSTSPLASQRRHRTPSMSGSLPNGSSPAHNPSTASHSLAAAATLNASLHNDTRRSTNGGQNGSAAGTPSVARRRSSIRMNLNLNDPALPAPGEMAMSPVGMNRLQHHGSGSPIGGGHTHHHRAPSLGEIHQEMESETEAQVNRLLGMIRQQQAQFQTSVPPEAATAVEDGTPTSESSLPLGPSSARTPSTHAASRPRSPFRPPAPAAMARTPSHHSVTSSPSSRPLSVSYYSHATGSGDAGDIHLPPAMIRDESAFYQAETVTLTRENQMLKQRIRELERQLGELGPASPEVGAHNPATGSGLREETRAGDVAAES